MIKDVKNYVKTCEICQANKASNHKSYGLLQPLPIPQQAWEDISMDFVTHLPPSNGKTTIWVIVDRFSKSAHFIPLPTHYTAMSLAPLFLTEIYRLHGMPKTIVSDRDRIFVSKFWKEIFRLSGTTLAFSSAYHPESDGQTEVVNRILQTYLRCFAYDAPNRWLNYLHLAEFWYNSSYQSSIRMSPFQAVYGRAPMSVATYIRGSAQIATVDEALTRRMQLSRLLKENLGMGMGVMNM